MNDFLKMNTLFKILLNLIIILTTCRSEDADFVDNKNEAERRDESNRRYDADRFDKDLDDDDWHVAHLKYAKMEGRRDCAGDTFQDKARRYRKALANDAALVNFVSSNPLPFNASDLLEDTCKVDPQDDKKSLNGTDKQQSKPQNIVTKAPIANDLKKLPVVKNVSKATSPVSKKEMNHQATTPTMRVTDDRSKEDDIADKEKEFKSRRGTEYMFSSVEYYDEIPDFDAAVCPDAVDVIVLEIDELRSYDVECERIVEWRSLND